MTGYKATPKQWENIEGSASDRNPLSHSACLLELRARVEALEAQASNYPAIPDSSTPPPVATDEELRETWDTAPGSTFVASRRAIYNLGVTHGQSRSREVADPAPVAGGLVEELVADLRIMAADAAAACQFDDAKILNRAATMLQQLGEQEAGR
jgi:hypothetical protein